MFIIITGTRASGKQLLHEYLVRKKGFASIRLNPNAEADVVPQTSDGEDGAKEDTTSAVAPLVFRDPEGLMQYVTRNWRQNFTTTDLESRKILDLLRRRPFVLVVYCDAPISVRYARHQSKVAEAMSLEDFILEHDRHVFGGSAVPATADIFHNVTHLTIYNGFNTIKEFYSHLEELNLLNHDRIRPSWDSYFMYLASLASLRSNCMKRRVGAILVKDNSVIATGYNGTPRGTTNCNQGGCPRCNSAVSSTENFEECLCLHAEENALLEAGRERVADRAILYCNTCPCLKCTIKIVQTGVKEVVYNLSYKMDKSSARLFAQAGVKLRQYSPPIQSSTRGQPSVVN